MPTLVEAVRIWLNQLCLDCSTNSGKTCIMQTSEDSGEASVLVKPEQDVQVSARGTVVAARRLTWCAIHDSVLAAKFSAR